MAKLGKRELKIGRGYSSPEAGCFVAQLDDLLERLRADLKGATKAELEWQPKAGMNTIGMLLAHNAIVEVYWTEVGIAGSKGGREVRGVLGIGVDDDGMPVAPRGGHPDALRGKSLGFYLDLLDRARAHTKQILKPLTDAAMNGNFLRTRADGSRWRISRRWMLYHLVEHFAAHHGQIGLLRHQYRDRRKK